MFVSNPLISVICCAHNEEEYVGKSIPLILKSLRGVSNEVLIVADRCSDKTIDIAREFNVKIIEKNWQKWNNSYAESLQTGYLKARGTYLSIIDADIAVPSNFFNYLLTKIKNNIASISADVITYPNTFWNLMFYAWEKTYTASRSRKEPRGAARIIVKRVLDDINGFQDVPAPDTNLDIKLYEKGYKSVAVSEIKTYHLRHLSIQKVISGQMRSGRARYTLGISLKRTLGHGILRFRPLVLGGWMLEWMKRKNKKIQK